jgi:hypothetical protein
MRCTLTTILITAFSFNCFAQSDRIDRLLNQINNDQIVINRGYFYYPEMRSYAVDFLITNIGEPATDKLINLLTDATKGIIAHFILSNIWSSSLPKPERIVDTTTHTADTTWSTPLRFSYYGLTFFVDDNNHIFALKKDLEENKNFWIAFIKEQNSR